MEIPKISSEWRILLKPQKYGDYVNDHTLFRDGGGWRIIGITGKNGGGPYAERYFIDAGGASLDKPMEERGKLLDTGALAWSPCVIRHGGLYFMYYGPSPTKMAVSVDAAEWMGYEIKLTAPFLACHRDHFVIQTGDGEWLMYASGITPDGEGSVCCLRSNDLINWTFCSYALRTGGPAALKPAWGALESPYVVRRGDIFYLFVTYTDCGDDSYNNTLVFASKNPLCFGEYSESGGGCLPVAALEAHAPEIVECSGKTFITTYYLATPKILHYILRLFPFVCVILLAGRQPACVVCLDKRKNTRI